MEELLKDFEKSLDDQLLSKFEKKAITAQLKAEQLSPQELLKLSNNLYNLAKENCQNQGDKQIIQWLENANKILSSNALESTYCHSYFSPGDDCYMSINQLLMNSKEEVAICVFTISDNRIADKILQAIQRGVTVRIITDDDKTLDKGSDIDFLASHGAQVKIDQSPHHMHHKFAIFDRKVLITGSYNWTRSASEFNQENLLETNNTDAVSSYLAEFERLWRAMYKL